MSGLPRPSQRLDLSEEYEVIIGEAKQRFTVPRCFLTKSSEFLEACCKGPWEESNRKRIELPTVDLDQFSIYLQFLYTSELATDSDDTEDDPEIVTNSDNGEDNTNIIESIKRQEQNSSKRFTQMIELATLSDFLRDAAFGNAASDAFILAMHKRGSLPGPSHLHQLVKTFSPFSIFYKLNVDFFASTGTARDLRCRGSNYPRQFVLDVAIELMERRDSGARFSEPTWMSRCSYHEHTAKVPYVAEQCSDEARKSAKARRG